MSRYRIINITHQIYKVELIHSLLKPRRCWALNTYRSSSQHLWQQPKTGKDTGIRIYNCIARKPVPLILANDTHATWYTCGPTVYDGTHLGHASCYVKLDIIQRILRQHFNVNLVTAINITDIDDKIISKSKESRKDWRDIARYYESEFWSDMRRLNVQEPNVKVCVTEQMPRIVDFIIRIIEQGGAYQGSDGSIYFALSQYANYGKLQKLNLESTEHSTADVEGKLSKADFALWKAKKSAEEPVWPSPWGDGRPGWHIECSTLASMIFGQQLDFHAGGLDLRFPHHENEEAQSCAYHKRQQWVSYWLHTGQLHINGQTVKMSKSLKNTISIDEMLQHYTADDFRMACALSNYRNSMDYGDALMQTSKNTLKRFKTFKTICNAYLSGKKPSANMESAELLKCLQRAHLDMDSCYKDDFDTSRSVGVLLEQVNTVCRYIDWPTSAEAIAPQMIVGSCLDAVAAVVNFVEQHLRILGFAFVQECQQHALGTSTEFDLESLVEDLLKSRRLIRERAINAKNKDLFRICDELRNCLQQHGIDIQDHSQGTAWQFGGVKK
ncbi:probable cysteine--tRNA ligase, mitochondrial [Eurosta solidaginis]|uniref:probable cysteine--tRNA ligase, mitochondrial n=1 Tax=Eurosta solidaginis TaxID=178769 RepID=UPI00353071AD